MLVANGTNVAVTLDESAVVLTEMSPDNDSESVPLEKIVGLDLQEPTRFGKGSLEIAISRAENVVKIRTVRFGKDNVEQFRSLAERLHVVRPNLPSVHDAVRAARTQRASALVQKLQPAIVTKYQPAIKAKLQKPPAARQPPVDPDARYLAGCRVIGGYGTVFRPGSVGTLQCTQGWVRFVTQSGMEWRKPYSELADVEIGGPGLQQTGGGYMGGGFGLTGALAGMVAAGAMNRATTRTQINTVIGLTAMDSGLVLHTSALTPDALRLHLAPLIGRLTAAKAADARHMSPPPPLDPQQRLARLEELKRTGGLTEEEYREARSRMIQDL